MAEWGIDEGRPDRRSSAQVGIEDGSDRSKGG